MAVNYNDRTGVLGIDLTPQNDSYQDFAFKPGSLKDKLINQLYNIEQSTGFSNPKLDQLKQEDMQQFQDKGTPLSLPSDAYTAMKISNFNDLFGPQTFTDALGTTRTLAGLDRPDINTAPFNVNEGVTNNVNEGVTNTNSFRNMLLDDLRNLPSDLRTSLGQTKDALVEDFSGLGSFLKDKSIKGFDFAKQIPGMAISAITGVPFLGQGLMSLLSGIKESPTDKVGLEYFGGSYDPYGYKSDLSSGNLGARQDPFGRNIVSAFSDYEQNRINELKKLTELQNLGKLNNKFKQDKLDFARNYLEKVRQEREQAQREKARQAYADVYARADEQGFTGPGGGFSTEQAGKEGAFGTFGEGRGRKDF